MAGQTGRLIVVASGIPAWLAAARAHLRQRRSLAQFVDHLLGSPQAADLGQARELDGHVAHAAAGEAASGKCRDRPGHQTTERKPAHVIDDILQAATRTPQCFEKCQHARLPHRPRGNDVLAARDADQIAVRGAGTATAEQPAALNPTRPPPRNPSLLAHGFDH